MEKCGQNIFYGFNSRKMGLLKNYYLKTLCSVRALHCITGSGIGALQDSLDPFRKESAHEYSLRIRSIC